jgi:predicted house-cleaning noncanonical NTP pyrophosphatase (MazG superfamily)
MGKALRELMKDEFEAELAKKVNEQVAEQVAEQAMTTAYSLADMGMSTDKIAQAIHYNIDTVIYWLENRTDK